jgi:hypothetical protein
VLYNIIKEGEKMKVYKLTISLTSVADEVEDIGFINALERQDYDTIVDSIKSQLEYVMSENEVEVRAELIRVVEE